MTNDGDICHPLFVVLYFHPLVRHTSRLWLPRLWTFYDTFEKFPFKKNDASVILQVCQSWSASECTVHIMSSGQLTKNTLIPIGTCHTQHIPKLETKFLSAVIIATPKYVAALKARPRSGPMGKMNPWTKKLWSGPRTCYVKRRVAYQISIVSERRVSFGITSEYPSNYISWLTMLRPRIVCYKYTIHDTQLFIYLTYEPVIYSFTFLNLWQHDRPQQDEQHLQELDSKKRKDTWNTHKQAC